MIFNHWSYHAFLPHPRKTSERKKNGKRSSLKKTYTRSLPTDENGENPLPPEEGQKVIDRLGGYEKMYRIKFEADYLAKLAYDGAKKLYGDPLSDEVKNHIRFELHVD